MRKNKVYALYKGEDCIAIGTAIQLAKATNVKISTIRFYATPTYKKRCKNSKRRKELVELEDWNDNSKWIF